MGSRNETEADCEDGREHSVAGSEYLSRSDPTIMKIKSLNFKQLRNHRKSPEMDGRSFTIILTENIIVATYHVKVWYRN